MSFSFTAAGAVTEVREQLARDPHPAFRHGGTLAAAVKELLSDVAAMAPDGKRLIVEASGHGDSSNVGLNIRVTSVYDWPDPPAEK